MKAAEKLLNLLIRRFAREDFKYCWGPISETPMTSKLILTDRLKRFKEMGLFTRLAKTIIIGSLVSRMIIADVRWALHNVVHDRPVG